MRRDISIVLVVLVLLAGCGRQGDMPVEAKSRLFGVTFQDLNNPFFTQLNDSIREQIESRGDQLITLGADYSSARQKNDVADFISQKVDGVFINPVDAKEIKASLLLLKKEKIPCIIIDTPAADRDLVLCQVVSDNAGAGRLVAQALARKNDHASVVILQVLRNKACMDRVSAFREELKKFPEMKILDVRDATTTEELARPVIIDLLRMYPECDAVFAINDPTALAAISAIELADKAGKITVVSVDGSKEGVKAVKKGNLEATAAQFPKVMGRVAAEKMYEHLSGKPVEKDVKIPVELITIVNASDVPTE